MRQFLVGLVLILPFVVSAPQYLPLNATVTGTLSSASTSTVCYNLTLPDELVPVVVWWDDPKLLVRVDPCQGMPHIKMSVYGCPSDGNRVVYEVRGACGYGGGR